MNVNVNIEVGGNLFNGQVIGTVKDKRRRREG
jgi:hypothetical protein